MTCCADDIQFLGHDCRYEMKKLNFKTKDWVDVEARMEYEFSTEYGEDVPVLYLENIRKAPKAKDEIVYFM